MPKKIIVVISVIIAVFVIIALSIFAWYNSAINHVSNDEIIHVIEVPMGSNVVSIADELKKEDLIKSTLAFRIYVKLNNISNFQAGNS